MGGWTAEERDEHDAPETAGDLRAYLAATRARRLAHLADLRSRLEIEPGFVRHVTAEANACREMADLISPPPAPSHAPLAGIKSKGPKGQGRPRKTETDLERVAADMKFYEGWKASHQSLPASARLRGITVEEASQQADRGECHFKKRGGR